MDLLIAMATKMLEGGEGAIGVPVGAPHTADLASFVRMVRLTVSTACTRASSLADYCVRMLQLLAAMTTATPHIRSAAVICVARVIYQFSNLGSVSAMANEVMPAVLTLFHDESREVVKSAVMFIRVAIACLDYDEVNTLVPSVKLRCWSRGFSPKPAS